MVNCTKNHMQEDDGEADDEIVARHEFNSYRGSCLCHFGKNSEQKGNKRGPNIQRLSKGEGARSMRGVKRSYTAE